MKSDQQTTPTPKPTASSNLLYRLSIGTLIAAALLIILSYVSYVQNNTQQASLDEQSRKTTELVQQVKDLSEQNKKLSQTAVNYAYCNSVIIARYTQDQSPITVENLNECVISSFPQGEGAPTIEQIRAGMNGELSPSAQSQTSGNRTQTPGGNTTPTNPGTTTPVAPSQPQNPQTPQNPQNPQNPTPNRPTNNLLTLEPSLLLPGVQLNTPCLQVANLLGTCRTF
jgi:hypothetical protein